MRSKRPFPVTIVLFGVLFLGAINAWRAFALSQQFSLSLALNIQPHPSVRIGLAIFWAGMFWGAAYFLARRRSWVMTAIPLLLALYAIVDLLLQAVFTIEPTPPAIWLMRTIAYAALVLLTSWALRLGASYLTH